MERNQRPQLSSIDFTDENLCAFYLDGRCFVPVTTDLLDKILKGRLVVTSYLKGELCSAIFIAYLYELN